MHRRCKAEANAKESGRSSPRRHRALDVIWCPRECRGPSSELHPLDGVAISQRNDPSGQILRQYGPPQRRSPPGGGAWPAHQGERRWGMLGSPHRHAPVRVSGSSTWGACAAAPTRGSQECSETRRENLTDRVLEHAWSACIGVLPQLSVGRDGDLRPITRSRRGRRQRFQCRALADTGTSLTGPMSAASWAARVRERLIDDLGAIAPRATGPPACRAWSTACVEPSAPSSGASYEPTTATPSTEVGVEGVPSTIWWRGPGPHRFRSRR
jgi:hypothetical protein